MPVSEDQKLIFFIDGAARGNPGRAGAGVAVCNSDGQIIARKKLYLGETTNNVAEYRSFLLALEESLARKAREVQIYTDSQLLARQWEGRYKVRDPKLKELYEKAHRLAGGLQSCQVTHIPREKNKEADALANQAIDDYWHT